MEPSTTSTVSDFMSSGQDFPLRGWSRDSSVVFRKTKDDWGGLSNMAGDFSISINEIVWRSSEAIYQALRFPSHPEVQEIIRREKSPMAAKMRSKPFRQACSRSDWDQVRVDVMYWCLQAKLVANSEKFGALLKATEKADIVEDSARDRFWGAVPVDEDRLEGRNVLGVLLMRLRREFLTHGDDLWGTGRLSVQAPWFGDCRLLNQEVLMDQVAAVEDSGTLF